MSLVDGITYFLARYRMPESEFGKRAAGNASLVDDIRRGRPLGAETAYRVQRFMDDYQPPRAAPTEVEEPRAPTRAAQAAEEPVLAFDRVRAGSAWNGSDCLWRAILALYERVAAREGIAVVDAMILLNHGPRALARWKGANA